MTSSPRTSREQRIVERRLERAHRQLGPRLVLLFLLGCVGFGYPFVGLFREPDHVAGIPSLFLYLFGGWALFILALALLIAPPRVQRFLGRRDRGGDR